MATRDRGKKSRSVAKHSGYLWGTLAVAIGLLGGGLDSGQKALGSTYEANSSEEPGHLNLDSSWLSQAPNGASTSEATIAEDEDSSETDDETETSEDQSIADSGLQQLLDALDAEPDLGPIPLETAEDGTQAISPYRLFVDLEVRGTSNAGYLPFDRDRSSDAVFTPTLTFLALPSITDNAQLLASIVVGSSIYANEDDLAFGYLAGSIGVNWDFAPLWFTRLELQGQQLLAFENDDYQGLALQYQVGRGNVFSSSSLYLRYFYQLRGSLTNDSDLDRIGNSLNASVQFPLNKRLQGRILYRLLFDSFFNDSRTDINNRIRGEVRYAINDLLSVRGFTTYTNNLSIEGDRDYDDVSVGVGFTANFPLGSGR
ncbi:MAG: hypothetical protein AB4050_09725 [Synechococcus sp.]